MPELQAGWQPFGDGFRVEIRVPDKSSLEQVALFWIDSDADGSDGLLATDPFIVVIV